MKWHMKRDSTVRSAYVAILLLGLVSLMGDVIYEGSRGLIPNYLAFLGASSFMIVFAGRLGEFFGYAVRLVSGVLADTTRAYWIFIFIGYGLIISVPFLGLAPAWEIAIILVVLERVGKAVRSPARDAVLSTVSKDVGTGKAFGLHELLDQIGAVLGPLIVATLMFLSANNYRQTFTFLFLPFMVLMAVLIYTYGRIGRRRTMETKTPSDKGVKLEKPFFIYTSAIFLNTVGLIPYELILYKAGLTISEADQWLIPLIYMLIQLVDAPTALFSGYFYDKFKVKVLVLPFILSIVPPLFAMVNADLPMLIIAAVFFGLVLGMQESIYRAAVSEFAPLSSRGTAYGIFNTVYGVGLLAGGAVYGLMASLTPPPPFAAIILYVLATQIAAVILLLNVHLKRVKT